MIKNLYFVFLEGVFGHFTVNYVACGNWSALLSNFVLWK